MTRRVPRFVLGLVLAAGCSSTGANPPNENDLSMEANTDMPQGNADMSTGGCAHTPKCTDQQILEMSLFKKASTRVVENTADGNGWSTHVDATGGGFTPTESFVYAKFTDTGLMRVAVGDEAAFASQEWDIAFRRFLIRLNSGVSGPSCVLGAEATGSKYDSLNTVPNGTLFDPESYYDETTCKVVEDSSGLGSPATILSGFWHYESCVQMTGKVYLVQLADGRALKLTVTSYYAPDAQTTCDQTGMVPMGSAGGQVRLRWAFLGK